MLNRTQKIIVAAAIITCVAATAGAQDFSFSTPGGQNVNLSSMRGNVVVLLFSGVQDPQRRDGLKAMQSLAERYQGKNVKFCWVSINSASELTNDQLSSLAAPAPSISV